MARVAISEGTKAAASRLAIALSGAWADCAVKSADGTIDQHQTDLALRLALRTHLRTVGQLAPVKRNAPDIDWANIDRAIYVAFVSLPPIVGASGVPEAPLAAVIYKAIAALEVPYEQIDKARKIVREALDRPESLFTLISGAKRFDGVKVGLKNPAAAPAPEAFRKWGTPATTAPAAATPAPAAAPAPAAKPGKAKGK